MQIFLKNIAETFYQNERENLKNFAFVFPNHRAGIFFKKHLSTCASEPIFAPKIQTFQEFYSEFSTLKLENNLGLLFRLFSAYNSSQNSASLENFDHFIRWGEMLLSDFADIENYRIDAEKLFQNIADLKEIESVFSGFGEEEIKIIENFWKHFLPVKENQEIKKNFLQTWQNLPKIYKNFTASLRAENLGYEALIARDACENLESGKFKNFSFSKVVFIGFNALNEIEKSIFIHFQKLGIADFYWDYSSKFFVENNPATHFKNENLKKFPSFYEIKTAESPKNSVEIIGVPSNIGQTKHISKLLAEISENDDNQLSTAVVLPDEKLLIPLLQSTPPALELNVTMGYPMSLTKISTFVHLLFDLQNSAQKNDDSFFFKPVLRILNHAFVRAESPEKSGKLLKKINEEKIFRPTTELFFEDEFLKEIFTIPSKTEETIIYIIKIIKKFHHIWKSEENLLEQQFLTKFIEILNQINLTLQKFKPQIQLSTLRTIIDKIVFSTRIPINGFPLAGIQIMGLLETRSLNFKTLIIPSCNENVFPRQSSTPSCIPYNLRKAFKMPTYETLDAINSYIFYRLIDQAERVFLLYNSNPSDNQSGEKNRFIQQLNYLYKDKISLSENEISFKVQSEKLAELSVKKDEKCFKNLEISPSSFDDFLHCPLKFYFKKIKKINTKDELSEEIQANTLGTIVHNSMEKLYKNCYEKQKLVTVDEIKILETCAKKCVKSVFEEELKSKKLTGYQKLILSVATQYVENILKHDKKIAPFTILGLEKTFEVERNLTIENKLTTVKIKGNIDRIHEKNGVIHIVDYKTGNIGSDAINLEKIFNVKSGKSSKEIFQTLIYALFYKENNKENLSGKRIQPNIYHLNTICQNDFDPRLRIDCNDEKRLNFYDEIETKFLELFDKKLTEIFNISEKFSQTENSENCKYCDFTKLCSRENEDTY